MPPSIPPRVAATSDVEANADAHRLLELVDGVAAETARARARLEALSAAIDDLGARLDAPAEPSAPAEPPPRALNDSARRSS